MGIPPWVADVAGVAGRYLGLRGPLVFPAPLVEVFAAGHPVLTLDPARVPAGAYATPLPEFGVLGPDMPEYAESHEFARWLPGAWPVALDGGGGFYCLDVRAGTTAPTSLVWSHAGTLGWDEHVFVTADLRAFLAA